MAEKEFIKSMYELAKRLKGNNLTESDKKRIIKYFNTSKKTTTAEKAVDAVEKATGKFLSGNIIYFEKSASSTLDNIDNLLMQMKIEASKWEKERN